MLQPIMPVNYNIPTIAPQPQIGNQLTYTPTDYYRNLINQQTSLDIHKRYYPDLTDEEFNMNQNERNEVLYKKGKLEQLAKYGTFTNCGDTFKRVKDNQDFKELINSKYLNSANGFVRIINNLKLLEDKRQEKLSYGSYPSPYCISVMKLPFNYQDYNMSDYLRILNDFTKNDKISDDLKQYYLLMKSDNLELYYTKLNKLKGSNNPIDILTEKNFYVKE